MRACVRGAVLCGCAVEILLESVHSIHAHVYVRLKTQAFLGRPAADRWRTQRHHGLTWLLWWRRLLMLMLFWQWWASRNLRTSSHLKPQPLQAHRCLSGEPCFAHLQRALDSPLIVRWLSGTCGEKPCEHTLSVTMMVVCLAPLCRSTIV